MFSPCQDPVSTDQITAFEHASFKMHCNSSAVSLLYVKYISLILICHFLCSRDGRKYERCCYVRVGECEESKAQKIFHTDLSEFVEVY